MEPQLYFWWSSISLAIFYLLYFTLLKRETFFMLNRIYLLSALCLSLVIPLIDLSALVVLPKMELLSSTLLVFAAGKLSVIEREELNWLSIIYWTGVIIKTTWLAVKLIGIKRHMKLPEKGSAFSFWKTKVIDQELASYAAIDAHENIHVRQLHTLDIMLVEVIGIFFWFNPVVYCYRNSLKFIHEYLADEHAASFAETRKQYAMVLFMKNFKVGPALANTFYKPSLLGARIKMLQRQKSRAHRQWKYGLFIPLIVLLVVTCSFDSTTFNNDVMGKADQPAIFPGGFEAFSKYLIKTSRKVSNKEGTVKVSFIVETSGEVTNEKIELGLDEARDKEALRVIRQSPKWEPALQNGKKVRSAYQIGINVLH
jgi:hypothetical protein